MAEGDWTERQAGSAAGSVVPPPAAEVSPEPPKRLPKRKPGEQLPRPGRRPPSAPPPPLPDSVRSRFTATVRPESVPTSLDPDQATGAAVRPAEITAGQERAKATVPAPPAEFASPAGQPAGTGPHDAGPDWWQPAASGRAAPNWRRIGGIAAAVAALIAVGGTALALSDRHAGGPAVSSTGTRAPGTTANATRGMSLAGRARVHAAAWISREVSKSAIVACDAVMCSSLYGDGTPASNLLVISPNTPDPLGADLVVATPVIRSELGRRLSSEYAPTVLASFGSGATRVDVRVVASLGAAAYQRALAADVAARQAYGQALLRNKRITLPARAVVELAAGWIDSRLLLMLPVLATQHPLRVLSFGDQAPGAGYGVPMTSVELSALGRPAGLSDHAYLRWLLGFLHGQRPPYVPNSISVVTRRKQSAVIVTFARPSPIGLLAH